MAREVETRAGAEREDRYRACWAPPVARAGGGGGGGRSEGGGAMDGVGSIDDVTRGDKELCSETLRVRKPLPLSAALDL